MGGAGGEGFGASFSGADAKHRGHNVGIGEKHQEEGQEGHDHGDAEAQEGLGGGVRAGGLDHSQVVTEAVVDVNSAGKSHVGGLCTAGMGRRRAASQALAARAALVCGVMCTG